MKNTGELIIVSIAKHLLIIEMDISLRNLWRPKITADLSDDLKHVSK